MSQQIIKVGSFSDVKLYSMENRLETLKEATRRFHPSFRLCGTTQNKVFVIDEDTGETYRFDYEIGAEKKVSFKNASRVVFEHGESEISYRRKMLSEKAVDALIDGNRLALSEADDSIMRLVEDDMRQSDPSTSNLGVTIRDLTELALNNASSDINLAVAKATGKFGLIKKLSNAVIDLAELPIRADVVENTTRLVKIAQTRRNAVNLKDDENFKTLVIKCSEAKEDGPFAAALKQLVESFSGDLFCLTPNERRELFAMVLGEKSTNSESIRVLEGFNKFVEKRHPTLLKNLNALVTEGGKVPFALAIQELSESIDISTLENINIVELRDVIKTVLNDGRESKLMSKGMQGRFESVVSALNTMLEIKQHDLGVIQVAVNEVAVIAPTTFFPADKAGINNEFPGGLWAAASPDLNTLGKNPENPFHVPVQITKEDADTLLQAWWMNVDPNTGQKIGVTEDLSNRLEIGIDGFKTIRKNENEFLGQYGNYSVYVECNGAPPSLSVRMRGSEVAKISVVEGKYAITGSDSKASQTAQALMNVMVPSWMNEAFGCDLMQKAEKLKKKLDNKGFEDDPDADKTLADADKEEDDDGGKEEEFNKAFESWISEENLKVGDVVKVNLKLIPNQGVPDQHRLKIVRQILKNGNGTAKIFNIKNGYALIAEPHLGAAIMGGAELPLKALRLANESNTSEGKLDVDIYKSKDSWTAMNYLLKMIDDSKTDPKGFFIHFEEVVGHFKNEKAMISAQDYSDLYDLIRKWADNDDQSARKKAKEILTKLVKKGEGKISEGKGYKVIYADYSLEGDFQESMVREIGQMSVPFKSDEGDLVKTPMFNVSDYKFGDRPTRQQEKAGEKRKGTLRIKLPTEAKDMNKAAQDFAKALASKYKIEVNFLKLDESKEGSRPF
jgi:hypothetical protein